MRSVDYLFDIFARAAIAAKFVVSQRFVGTDQFWQLCHWSTAQGPPNDIHPHFGPIRRCLGFLWLD